MADALDSSDATVGNQSTMSAHEPLTSDEYVVRARSIVNVSLCTLERRKFVVIIINAVVSQSSMHHHHTQLAQSCSLARFCLRAR